MKPTILQLAQIITTAGTQIRAAVNQDAVAEYADAMNDGAIFPPVVVFHDGSEYILADGFHRVMAGTRNGFKDIEADVRKGTRSDALKYALGANTAHGLKRTNADKRRSVELALSEWPKLSDRELSNICAVSDSLVLTVRREATAFKKQLEPEVRIGKDGKTRKLPAKKSKPQPTEEPPEAERPHIIAEPIIKSSKQEAEEAFKSLEPKEGDEDPFLDALIIAWEEAPKSSREKFRKFIS
jgi:ParB-like chromosome segregation protein Spo0J